MLASAGLAEKGVEGVVASADGLVGRHLSVRLDSVLEAVQLPASIADLHASLSDVDRYALALQEREYFEGFCAEMLSLTIFSLLWRKKERIVAKPAQPRNGGFARQKNDCAILACRFYLRLREMRDIGSTNQKSH